MAFSSLKRPDDEADSKKCYRGLFFWDVNQIRNSSLGSRHPSFNPRLKWATLPYWIQFVRLTLNNFVLLRNRLLWRRFPIFILATSFALDSWWQSVNSTFINIFDALGVTNQGLTFQCWKKSESILGVHLLTCTLLTSRKHRSPTSLQEFTVKKLGQC